MARRDAARRAMRDHDISQRRACVLVGVDPKTVRRERPPDNPEIREEMHKIAEKRRRFGYRRVGILLERKGMIMNEKKLYRNRPVLARFQAFSGCQFHGMRSSMRLIL